MYRLSKSSDIVIRLHDYAFIPNDMGNADWREYQTWLSEGNTPEPAENDDYGFVQIELPDPPVPAEPTPLEKLQAAGLTVADLKSLLGLS